MTQIRITSSDVGRRKAETRRSEPANILFVLLGAAFCGWVAITPSAGYVTVGQSIFIAFVITLICNVAVYWRSHTSIDDALDVFPTHGTGGIFGTVLTGIFIQE